MNEFVENTRKLRSLLRFLIMTTQELDNQNTQKKIFFYDIGLDTDLEKIHQCCINERSNIFLLPKAIIDATHDLCVAI